MTSTSPLLTDRNILNAYLRKSTIQTSIIDLYGSMRVEGFEIGRLVIAYKQRHDGKDPHYLLIYGSHFGGNGKIRTRSRRIDSELELLALLSELPGELEVADV